MSEKKSIGTAKKPRRWLLWLAAAIAVVAVTVFAVILANAHNLSYNGEAPVRVYIPAGTSGDGLRDTLLAHLPDGYVDKVMMVYALSAGSPDKSVGSYVISPGDRFYSTARRIAKGLQTPVKVTFNNIRTFDDLSRHIAARMAFSPADFRAAADTLLPRAGYADSCQFAAAFVPDTYEFYWTAGADKVITRMTDTRNAFWTGHRRASAEALGLTPVQVATLASIVEEETNDPQERGMVARLYLNRLAKGMRLQADPTVKFALGDFTLRRIGGDMLRVNSPYNTYVTAGLPPGPIRIPERRTMEAVLDAPQHNYLYMCAKPDFSGHHNFATDYATHLANARAYQQALNARNIRR